MESYFEKITELLTQARIEETTRVCTEIGVPVKNSDGSFRNTYDVLNDLMGKCKD